MATGSAGLFVGREKELAALDQVLRSATQGRGRAALVLGDAGIGKTALVEAFAETAAARGVRVAWGRCADAEAPPYWPWRQALRSLGGGRESLSTSTSGVRDELFATVVEELEAATADAAVLLVIDDLHWADASSLALLRFVVGVLPDLPLALVLTARDVPVELSPDAAAAMLDLPPAVLRLPVLGLARDATEQIVRGVYGDDAPSGFVSDVYDRTAGNPFFVQEVVVLQRLQGGRGFAVPPGVRQVLGRRLARLSQPAHEILTAAAVAGDLDAELLARMTGRPHAEVLDLLDEAIRARLVIQRDAGLAFAHALVSETLYEEQSHALRAEWHGVAAMALGERAKTRAADDSLDARLAAHWLRAPGDEAREKAAHHAIAAARDAVARMAYEQATRYYTWALDAGARNRRTLLLELGEAQVLAGHLVTGRVTLATAASLALEDEQGDDLARAVLAMGGGIGGFEVEVGDQRQIELLTAALRVLPEGDGVSRAAVLGRLSITLAGSDTTERRVELARTGADMAARLGDAPAEVAALAAYCDAISGPDHCDQRLAATARMIELVADGGDPRLLLLARRMRVVALLERGRFAEAEAEMAAYAGVAERLRLPLYLWPVEIWRSMRALTRADFVGADRHASAAEELGRAAQSLNAELMVFTARVWLALATGTSSGMADRFRWAVEVTAGYPVSECFMAGSAFEADPDLARDGFERARRRGLSELERDAEWLEAVWLYGDAAMRYGDAATAAEAYDALLPYAEMWAFDGIGAACFGVVAHQLGRLAVHVGRADDGRRWLEQAADIHRAAGAPLLVGLTEWALAEVGSPRPMAAVAATAATPDEGEFRRDGRVWRLQWRGQTATAPDSKGMHDLATLLAAPGRDIHVLDLVEAAGGPGAATADRDGAPVLDRAARRAYTRRLEAIESDLTEAEDHGDPGRAARLREERDFLAAELAGALGLGGRDRRTGDRVERARKAVAMRIATALRAVAEVHPGLARHLQVSVSTGRFCVYRPETPARWRT